MRAALILACVALVGCSAGASRASGPDGELEAQRRIWQQAGLESYRFEFQQQCFCVVEQVQPVVIEVRGGRIARVIAGRTGEDITGEPNLRWYTVEELFDVVSKAREEGAEPIVVRYDSRLGHPTHIEIGSLAADAGVVYSVSNLEAL